MKCCKVCQKPKPYAEFYKNKAMRDGHFSQCRTCRGAYGARYFRNNRAVIKAKKPERNHRYSWQLRQRVFAAYGNACSCCGETCVYFLQITHPNGRHAPHVQAIGYVGGDQVCRYLKKHHFPSDYRLLCGNCLRAIGSFRFCPHQEEDHRQLSRVARSRWIVRCEVLHAYGHHCMCCGVSTNYFLEVDHPDGDGQQERKALGIKAGSQFYKYLKQEGFPQRYRLLCSNCNTSRGWYGFCPHVEAPPPAWRVTSGDKP